MWKRNRNRNSNCNIALFNHYTHSCPLLSLTHPLKNTSLSDSQPNASKRPKKLESLLPEQALQVQLPQPGSTPKTSLSSCSRLQMLLAAEFGLMLLMAPALTEASKSSSLHIVRPKNFWTTRSHWIYRRVLDDVLNITSYVHMDAEGF